MFHQKNMIVKNIEKNNLTITLNVLYVKKANVYPTYVSKHIQIMEKKLLS